MEEITNEIDKIAAGKGYKNKLIVEDFNMYFQWVALLIIICFLVFSYYKRYLLKTRLFCLGALLIGSFILMLPIFGLSIFTLLGLFLFERLWVLLAAVLFIETVINKKGRVITLILGILSIFIYLFIRTFI